MPFHVRVCCIILFISAMGCAGAGLMILLMWGEGVLWGYPKLAPLGFLGAAIGGIFTMALLGRAGRLGWVLALLAAYAAIWFEFLVVLLVMDPGTGLRDVLILGPNIFRGFSHDLLALFFWLFAMANIHILVRRRRVADSLRAR